MFTIIGIRTGYSNEEFVLELVRLNSDVENDLQIRNVDAQIKVIARKKCRNPYKENFILEAPPNIAKWFLKKQKVFFDLVNVHFQKHIKLAFCHNCCGFQHIAKRCKDKACCYQCGGEHTRKSGVFEFLNCSNWTKIKLRGEDGKHAPAIQRRLEQYKSHIDYSEPFL